MLFPGKFYAWNGFCCGFILNPRLLRGFQIQDLAQRYRELDKKISIMGQCIGDCNLLMSWPTAINNWADLVHWKEGKYKETSWRLMLLFSGISERGTGCYNNSIQLAVNFDNNQ